MLATAGAGDDGLHRIRHVRGHVRATDATDGGLHRSREHLMLVMLRDGDRCYCHVRDAAGAGDSDLWLAWICCW